MPCQGHEKEAVRQMTTRKPNASKAPNLEKITLDWLWNHVPVYWWYATLSTILALVIFLFGLGVWVGKNEWVWEYRDMTGTSVPKAEESCNNYGIKITDAKPNQAEKEKLTVYGIYKSKPKKENIYLFVVEPNGQGYWPQNPVNFNSMNNTWSSDVHSSDNAPPETYIIAAIVGEAGQVLVDYYYKVGKETRWTFIDRLTNDIIECDRRNLK